MMMMIALMPLIPPKADSTDTESKTVNTNRQLRASLTLLHNSQQRKLQTLKPTQPVTQVITQATTQGMNSSTYPTSAPGPTNATTQSTTVQLLNQ